MEKITKMEVVLILINKKPGISMDEIIERTLKLDKPLELRICKDYNRTSEVKNSVDEMVSIGLIKEITERYGDTKNVSYSLTEGGKKAYEDRMGKLMTLENSKIVDKINKYLKV